MVEVVRGLTKLSDLSSSSSKTLKFRSSVRPFYTEFTMLRIGIGKTKKAPFLSRGNPCRKFAFLCLFTGKNIIPRHAPGNNNLTGLEAVKLSLFHPPTASGSNPR